MPIPVQMPRRMDEAQPVAPDADALIAALHAAGAAQSDPLRLRYVEALARRARVFQGSARRLLDARLLQAIAALQRHCDRAHGEWKETVDCGVQGDSLGALVRRLEQASPEEASQSTVPLSGPRAELKVMREFRQTWSTLSADQQVAQALLQAPRNAGPINSHMLVLRSLALMRDISPDYLGRFVSYSDTLLCLDQVGKDKPDSPKKLKKATPAKR